MSEILQNQLYRLILHQHQQKWAKAVKHGGEVKYPHQSEPLTPELLQAQIDRKITIGAMLLQPGTNAAKAGCIDIDVPRDARDLHSGLALARKIQQTAGDRNLHSYIEFSGNRGWHLWIFSVELLPGATWMKALSALASAADFTAKEVFPNHELTESKCIKLPSAVHLKSARKSGFICDENLKLDNEGYPVLPQQGELMASFIQNPPEAIAALAAPNNPPLEPKTEREAGKKDFSDFAPNQHPGCIQHLIAHGAPLMLDYNAVNLTLSRYAITRGMSESAALELASAVAKATPENHPTSKDDLGKVSNFTSAFKSAVRKGYGWDCAYALSGINTRDVQALNSRGCIAEKCPMWNYTRKSESQGKFLNAAIWQAITDLAAAGAEIRLSTVLAKLENIEIHEISDDNWKASDADTLVEREILAFLLQNPESIAEVLAQDISKEGFISCINEAPADYLAQLALADIPQHETFLTHLQRIRDTGLRVLAGRKAREADKNFSDRTAPVVSSLDTLITSTQNLLRRTSSEIQPMEAYSSDLIADLFSKPEAAIATPSQWLNNAFNGGFAPGKLYVFGAPPGHGKTTFCNWCGDYAALHGIPVLNAAYEMSKNQLWSYSLARLAGINSALIESKRWNDESYQTRETLLSRVKQAAKDYHQKIAPRLIILECGPEHTAAKLKGAIAQIRHNAGLSDDVPVLLIVDYLQLMLSGDEKLDTAAAETLRVSRIATALKQLARDTKAAVLAISDITKAAYQQALSTGSLDMSALRDSFKIAHAADVIALLQTGRITVGRGDNAQQQDQLEIAAQKYPPEKQRLIDQARIKFPLNEASRDTYARLSILKNRGGILADPLFIYHKALHKFTSIDLDLGVIEHEDSI